MINKFQKEMLKKSLDFLSAVGAEPINLSGLQKIINHASEECDSIKNVKFKYLVENPDNGAQLIFGVTKHQIIDELNMISFETDKTVNPYDNIKKTSDSLKIEVKINPDIIYSIDDLQKIIDNIKSSNPEWGNILINLENVFFPSMYKIEDNSVYIRITNGD
jgi:hypothetical protein